MAGTDKATILVVDDQPGKLLSYEAMLSELGDTLLTASSAREALDRLLRNEVAVVLIDVCMPELDGFELAGMMRDHPRFQKTPIIFVSGVHLTEFDRLKGYACGAVDYVSVPVVPEILRAKVSVFTELFRKTRALERLNRELEQRVAERTAELQASTASLREREEALQEASHRKDEFLAILAHEIRNPLAPIRTAVQLMRVPRLSEAQRAKAGEVIERQVEHLVRLVDDLLDVARITHGTMTLQREQVDVADAVARAVETTRPLIDQRRHELSITLTAQPVVLDGDLTRLSQILGNLLNNAAKYTEPGGRIQVRVERDGRDVVIRVEDSGVGIHADMLPKVFDLFARAGRGDHSTGGLGIGLALVRRLAEMHGGTVTAESRGVGYGTQMILRLPIGTPAQIEVPATTAGEGDESAMRPQRVLIVDDNQDAADLMALQVQLTGHEVRTAHDGYEALSVAQSFVPDILLLDLGLPGLNGFEIARRVRQEPWGRTLTLIAVTGWGQEQDRRRTTEAGFDGHLVKPVAKADLMSVLGVDARQPAPGPGC